MPEEGARGHVDAAQHLEVVKRSAVEPDANTLDFAF